MEVEFSFALFLLSSSNNTPTNDRVSNLKYESVRIDSKTVVFIRTNHRKKPQTDRICMSILFGNGALFRTW